MNKERMVPLYEAKMIHHYDAKWATYGNGHLAPSGLRLRVKLPAERAPVHVERMLRVTDTYWCRESVCLDRRTPAGAFFDIDTDGVLFHTTDELIAADWSIDDDGATATRERDDDGLRFDCLSAAQRVESWQRDHDLALVAYGRERGWIK